MSCLPSTQAGSIRNIILCIGDGMGPEQVKAARFYVGTNLFFESFPYQSTMTTQSASSSITDSAAAATAMATGVKVNNYVISLRTPGDGSELETLLEYFKDRGKATGLVVTSYITHATPAAFGAHEPSRNNLTQIASDYLSQSKPNILFGGGANGMTPSSALAAGYAVVTDANELFALDADAETFVSGQFGTTHLPYELANLGNLPHLHEMTQIALEILDNDPDGFFLMVEGARIDHAGHANNLTNNIHETLEFARSVETVFNWMGDREDTLILVTADHETGGLAVVADNGAGNYPTVTWSNTGHTAAQVPVYGIGLNAHLATSVFDNIDIPTVASSMAHVPEWCLSSQADATGFHMLWTSSSNDVYQLENTVSLAPPINWQPAGTFTATTTRLSISITNLPLTEQRFYRLISEK
ncbi:MAG: alkaline phosphatase [Verrucomicrobiota bacterium]